MTLELRSVTLRLSGAAAPLVADLSLYVFRLLEGGR